MLWQSDRYAERAWIEEIFGPCIDEHIFDGERRIVLDDCILIDSYLHARSSDYYAGFRGKNAWLIHLSDETYEGGYRNYSYFRGVFRNYWSDIFSSRRVLQIPLGYTAGLARRQEIPAAGKRAYLWSFLGAAHGSRPDMLRALQVIEPNLTHITNGRKPAEPLGRDTYQRILRDSVFVPCPMGNVNMESFRVYEALECGAIPILEKRLTLDYFARLLGDSPIPRFANWSQASAFIASIRTDEEQILALQVNCVEWWRSYKSNLRSQIQEFLSVRQEDSYGPFVSRRYSLPGWQATELLRHHSPAAAYRRVMRQAERLLTGQKLRKTEGC